MKSDNTHHTADIANTEKAVSTDNTNGVVNIYNRANTDSTANSANESSSYADEPMTSAPANETEDTVPTQSDESAPTSVPPPAAKQQRVGIKQRKTDFAAYKETYFSPVLLNTDTRHAINITKETWALLERYSRILGDGIATVGGYADRIIADHFAAYLDDLEAWRKL